MSERSKPKRGFKQQSVDATPRSIEHSNLIQHLQSNMSLTTINTAPTVDNFTPLSEHHEQTPGSFFAGKPVLHLQAPASKLQISKDELEANEAVKALVATTDDAAVDADGLVEIQDIDVWVTSRYDQRDARFALLQQLY